MSIMSINPMLIAFLVVLMVSPALLALHIAQGMKKTDSTQNTTKKLFAIHMLIGK